ncbi:MAG: SDR family NAD(P)-dependent oxidoreductase [Planctomycetota bacterium]|nr:SDR family NAD(P)-dependent oxidoreductase [Planctomycetota bacterium]
MEPQVRRTALVTGANRGIGLATARALARAGLAVVVSARRESDAAEAAASLRAEGLDARPEALDVSDERSVRNCAGRLASAGIPIDVLVNNGAVLHEGDLLGLESRLWRASFDINALGPIWTARAFVPAMLTRGYGRIVNVSSGWGAFSEGLDGPASYSVTKAALNAATVVLARSLTGDVKANACCPGWVRTRMGGAEADLSPDEAAPDIVWLCTLPSDGPSGGLFRHRQRIDW